MSAATIGSEDIRKIIAENFNDTDVRFSNDDILNHLKQLDRYNTSELDVLDLENTLLGMEKSGLLRPIAQNFNTRYYRLWGTLEQDACKSCGTILYFSPAEDEKLCPNCTAKV